METQTDGNEETIATIKAMRQRLEARIDSHHSTQLELLASLQSLVPDIVSSLDLSLKTVSSFNGRPFSPTPNLPNPKPKNPTKPLEPIRPLTPELPSKPLTPKTQNTKPSLDGNLNPSSGSPLLVLRSMVAVCLLERVPFTAIDSSTVLRKLENDQRATPAEKAALRDLGGGELGAILAVETALRSMAEDNGGVELEEFVVSGKSRLMVLGIDRTKLIKDLPESANLEQQVVTSGVDVNGGVFGIGGPFPRPMQDLWMGPGDPNMSGMGPMFPGGGPMVGPRGGQRVVGMMGMSRGMGVPPLHRPPLGPNVLTGGSSGMLQKGRSEEDELKYLEALLNKKSFKEMQKSKTGEELLDLIHRPTAKETAVAAKVCERCRALSIICMM